MAHHEFFNFTSRSYLLFRLFVLDGEPGPIHFEYVLIHSYNIYMFCTMYEVSSLKMNKSLEVPSSAQSEFSWIIQKEQF